MTQHTGTADTGTGDPLGAHLVDDELLTITEAAALLRTPVATLRYWRHLGTGPRSFRVGRSVRYWRTEINTWLQQQEQNDTAGVHPVSPSR